MSKYPLPIIRPWPIPDNPFSDISWMEYIRSVDPVAYKNEIMGQWVWDHDPVEETLKKEYRVWAMVGNFPVPEYDHLSDDQKRIVKQLSECSIRKMELNITDLAEQIGETIFGKK